MSDFLVVALLRKYVRNQCTADELERVKEIIKSGEYIDEWQMVIEEDAEEPVEKEENISLNKSNQIFSRIEKSIKEKKEERRHMMMQVLKVAASILVLAVAVVSWIILSDANEFSTVATDTISRKKIELPDGSKVWINKNSDLKFPHSFGKSRDVYLQGEAFFDIAKDPSRPFIVHVSELQTIVLGTSFNIDATTKHVKITVVTGKVKVIGRDNSEKVLATLTPGQQLSVEKRTHLHKLKRVNTEAHVQWKDQLLVFNNTSIKEAARRIEDYFHVPIRLDEKIANCKIKVSFKNESLEEVLEVIKIIAAIDIERRNKEIFLSGKGCN